MVKAKELKTDGETDTEITYNKHTPTQTTLVRIRTDFENFSVALLPHCLLIQTPFSLTLGHLTPHKWACCVGCFRLEEPAVRDPKTPKDTRNAT